MCFTLPVFSFFSFITMKAGRMVVWPDFRAPCRFSGLTEMSRPTRTWLLFLKRYLSMFSDNVWYPFVFRRKIGARFGARLRSAHGCDGFLLLKRGFNARHFSFITNKKYENVFLTHSSLNPLKCFTYKASQLFY